MRSRNLKPGIFTNPEIARMGDSVFRLFTGLWCLADRKGRLKDDPDKIEAQIFPFRFQESKTKAFLDLLAAGDDPFITRYEVEGIKYIQIRNFLKHQNPHPRESTSEIPPSTSKAITRHSLGNAKDMTSPADVLIPSSLRPSDVLIPDSCITPAGVKPYQMPDPKTEPRKCLVLSYKSRKGVSYDNRDWDKVNFGRSMVAAGALLGLCQDLGSAENCLNDLGSEYDGKGISWTLETIARNAPEWLNKNGRTDANASRAGLRLAISQRKSESRNQTGLVNVSESTVPATLRDRPDSENGNEESRNGDRTGAELNEPNMD